MDNKEYDRLKGQIRKGDYVTLGEMIGENQETARSRFRRKNDEAISAMKKIVENRKQLIEAFKK